MKGSTWIYHPACAVMKSHYSVHVTVARNNINQNNCRGLLGFLVRDLMRTDVATYDHTGLYVIYDAEKNVL